MEEIVFPNQLRMMRRIRGARMSEIATLLNLSISALSKIEKGYRRLNADQMRRVADFLDCPVDALLVSDRSSQPEVVAAWKSELNNRRQMNVGGGLKVLGAGLRYIRGQKKMTLNTVAKGAKLTLSVYHRIEMGQREVDEKTFANIAAALGMSDENLQLQIYELDHNGTLDDLKNNSGKKGVGLFKGGYNDLPVSRAMLRVAESREFPVSITSVLNDLGVSVLENATDSVLCPSTLASDPGLFAIRVENTSNMILPKGSILVVSPTMTLHVGDWAVCKKGLKRITQMDDNGVSVIDFNGKTDMVPLTDLQRVVWIVLI